MRTTCKAVVLTAPSIRILPWSRFTPWHARMTEPCAAVGSSLGQVAMDKHHRDRAFAYRLFRSLFSRSKLHQARAAEIEPVALRPVRDAHQRLAAARAADDRAHRRGVHQRRADRADRVAVGADHFCIRHLERKDLPEYAAGGVTVEVLFIACHAVPPLGPKRSVLMRDGSWPSSTSADATLSTSAVGPQTNACGCSAAGQATSASMPRSRRRR